MLRGVVVGIDRYRDRSISSLRCACSDAKSVYQLFQKGINPKDLSLRLLLDADATKVSVMKAIGEDLSRMANEEDVVFLYFAGHGSPETEGSVDNVSRYLVAHDTEYRNIFATGIDLERDLPRWYARLRCRLVLLIIDACFSGRAGGRTFEGPVLHDIRTKWRGPIQLKDFDLGEGRLMLAACGDNEVAREDDDLGHGIFTYHLLQVLTRPDTSSTIGIHSLYEEVAESVRGHTGGRQTPVITGRSVYARLPRLVSDAK